MALIDPINAFAAKGWWQAGVVKLVEYMVVIVVSTLAVHFLPASTANTVINGVSGELGIAPIVTTPVAQ